MDWRGDGYWLDPRPYLDALPEMTADLPSGARDFACSEEHYDFTSTKCIKDLKFRSLSVQDDQRTLTLAFAPNKSKHETGLLLTYHDVASVDLMHTNDPGVGWFGSALLDELLPDPAGVAHHIQMTGGALRVVAADVEAAWA